MEIDNIETLEITTSKATIGTAEVSETLKIGNAVENKDAFFQVGNGPSSETNNTLFEVTANNTYINTPIKTVYIDGSSSTLIPDLVNYIKSLENRIIQLENDLGYKQARETLAEGETFNTPSVIARLNNLENTTNAIVTYPSHTATNIGTLDSLKTLTEDVNSLRTNLTNRLDEYDDIFNDKVNNGVTTPGAISKLKKLYETDSSYQMFTKLTNTETSVNTVTGELTSAKNEFNTTKNDFNTRLAAMQNEMENLANAQNLVTQTGFSEAVNTVNANMTKRMDEIKADYDDKVGEVATTYIDLANRIAALEELHKGE